MLWHLLKGVVVFVCEVAGVGVIPARAKCGRRTDHRCYHHWSG
jgi:hypothetical protein